MIDPSRYLETLLIAGQRGVEDWEATWSPFAIDDTLLVDESLAIDVLTNLAQRLTDNYPFFHPSYAGQMLKPPHPVALAAYAMTQRINPNNHALDGGPATSKLEIEVVDGLKQLFDYDLESSLGHLTSSGTIANLEALWIGRELDPDGIIAMSYEAHYTHKRMCDLLQVGRLMISTDSAGRLSLDQLEQALKMGRVSTVVATAGTTAFGAVDPIEEIIELGQRYGARVHVDAAYGGFFRLLAGEDSNDLEPGVAAAFRAIAQADSVVVDPHKHGLQPYGCGAVLFRDAQIARFYKHDSPYTYYTAADLHLGEISLECSRAGASAAALWATLQVLPLESDTGFGPILRKTRDAAKEWADLIEASDSLRLITAPDLDILCFYPLPANGSRRTSDISALTERVFADLMTDPDEPLFLATLEVSPEMLAGHDLEWNSDRMTAFRSVLMKPEHARNVEFLHAQVRNACR